MGELLAGQEPAPPKKGPTMDPLVQTAIKALGINVPIYRSEVKDGKVTLYLYGHSQPVTWAPEKPAPAKKKTTRRSKK
jgi:hypothetical protein